MTSRLKNDLHKIISPGSNPSHCPSQRTRGFKFPRVHKFQSNFRGSGVKKSGVFSRKKGP
jgi:hypothetical protein